MLRYEDPPNKLVIHIGGNDIGKVRLGYLQYQLKELFVWLSQLMPETALIWSNILPRLQWRYSNNNVKMEKSRRRLNSTIATHMIKKGGCCIRYPDIQANAQFLDDDGVHLSKLGNSIMLNTLQGALETFVLNGKGGLTFPDTMH